ANTARSLHWGVDCTYCLNPALPYFLKLWINMEPLKFNDHQRNKIGKKSLNRYTGIKYQSHQKFQ
ncbi:hypothetical protein CWB64_18660, partial [Pseudoalteromonas sp. S410]